MSRNNDYITGNLLDFSNHQNYYKLIGIDLSRQKNTSIPQQIDFVSQKKIMKRRRLRKLEEDDSVTMLFIAGKQQKTILYFSLDSLIVTK